MSGFATYRPMEISDVEAAHALSLQMRWPHRLHDLCLFKRVGHGCVATDGRGTVIAFGMWFPYGDGLATVGMVIVAPEHQGKGIGRRLMATLMAAAGARTIRLIATEAGRPLYERLGFSISGTISQYQGVAKLDSVRESLGVRLATGRDWPSILALDAEASGGNRTCLIETLRDAGAAWVIERNGEVAGFSICRPFGRGQVVGPIVAADDTDAIALAGPPMREHASEFIRVDTPIVDGPLVDFLIGSGFANASRSAQMTLGRGRTPMSVATFAIASQALG